MTESWRPQRVRPKRVDEIARVLDRATLHGDPSVVLRGVTHDSREARPDDLYVARPGEHTHGIAHVDQAVANGAVAVLTDPESVPVAEAATRAVVEVAEPRAVMGALAAWVYDDPSGALLVFGVTGTNGKTTTGFLLEAGLRAAGYPTGLVGTVETRIAGEALPSARTTPEATDLQALFAVMRERGVDAVAMEVSSHALDLGRVDGTTFAVAGFTNLSQDHLDFHRDMEHYFEAKARLFTPGYARRAVVSVDDDWGRRMAERAEIPVTTVGRSDADWTWRPTRATPVGGSAVLTGPDGVERRLDVALPAVFNLANAALAFVMLAEAGITGAAVERGIASLVAVPGRMERVDHGQPFTTLVDYGHTPEAVRLLVAEARELAPDGGRVIVVLGCGGDRDRAKRPAMGAAAATADIAVLTSDNPRSEDPAAILAAVEEGARAAGGAAQLIVEPDRRVAIGGAVGSARPGDVVVVAGKGHERVQEFADRSVAFDDRVVLAECLTALGWPEAAA
jgi:UDP-N-acetylmuramoyl-L-alanyl-D-glutamate--2,6-diaminopimelate ligase